MRARIDVVIALFTVAALVTGCQEPEQAPPAAGSSRAAPPARQAEVASLIDARWVGFAENQPWDWEQLDRRITPDFQQFGFRPVGETEKPRPCQGCGVNPPTAEVTVYAPGKFDASDTSTGRRVDVNGRQGFIGEGRPRDPPVHFSEFYESTLLSWQYAPDSWATVRGMTPMTQDVDRMLELARALRPDERTPVRVPLRIADVPARMPLVSVETTFAPIYGPTSEFGTVLFFGPCVTLVKARACQEQSSETGSLSVSIWHRDDYPDRSHLADVPRLIGGKEGRYDASLFSAAVLVDKGVYVQFNLNPPDGPDRSKASGELESVLESAVWAANPANEAAWPPITDWVE
ncbi:MAG TPA: hypothetical protein VHH12_03675 [Mycobacterium sp.]|nr:hypothetical protein [Mycobacterium sp.]